MLCLAFVEPLLEWVQITKITGKKYISKSYVISCSFFVLNWLEQRSKKSRSWEWGGKTKDVFLFVSNICMLSEASIPFIQNCCFNNVVPVMSFPQHVLIVCVEELLHIHTRDVIVLIKSSSNVFAHSWKKTSDYSCYTITIVTLSLFFPYFWRRHHIFNVSCKFESSLNNNSRKKTFPFADFTFHGLYLGSWS